MKPPRPNAAAAPAVTAGKVRIIGGRWRGTKLAVPDSAGLRPTSDRVRETLFNWLMPVLPGAQVLDLFAGSGALGLEAMSRGAARAVLVERDAALIVSLRSTVAKLQGGEGVGIVQADALSWLATQPGAAFDLAFVDPPFAAGLWDPALAALLPKLRERSWLYIEAPDDMELTLPPDWTPHREGRTRDVRFALYRRGAG
jgi:16S rRNA (guanine966-N2)-methyltransferase